MEVILFKGDGNLEAEDDFGTNIIVISEKVMPRRKASKIEPESGPSLWELCVSGDVDMVREAVQRGDQVPQNRKHPRMICLTGI